MGYEDTEFQSVASSFCQGNVDFSTNNLGGRSIANRFSEIIELVSSVFFYDSDAVFYLVCLIKNYWNRTLQTEIEEFNNLISLLDSLLVVPSAITDVSSFSSLEKSLTKLNDAVSRDGILGSREFLRYNVAVSEAQKTLSPAAKLAYTPRGSSSSTVDIVISNQEAKSRIPQIMSSLRSLHEKTSVGISNLINALTNFNDSKLAELISKNQISRSLADAKDLNSSFSNLTPEKRVSEARNTLLRVVANSAVVKSVSNYNPPGTPKLLQEVGEVNYRITANGTGTAPSIVGVKSGPWPIRDGYTDILSMEINGNLVNVDLLTGQGSPPTIREAEVIGGNIGPFSVSDDLAVPHPILTKEITTGSTYSLSNKYLYLNVDSEDLIVGPFAVMAWSPTDLANKINTDLPNYVTATVESGGGNSWVKIAWNNTVSPPSDYGSRILMACSGPDNADDLENWRVSVNGTPTVSNISRGWSATNKLRIHPNYTAYVDVTLQSGSWPDYYRTASQIATDITTAGLAEFEGFDSDGRVGIRSLLLGEGSVISLETDSVVGNTAIHRTMLSLGFYPSQESKEHNVSAQSIANSLNLDSSFSAEAIASIERKYWLDASRAVVTGLDEIDIPTGLNTDPTTEWDDLDSLTLIIANGNNAGSYGIVSSSFNTSTRILTLTLDRDFRDISTTVYYQLSIVSQYLKITSKDNSVNGSIEILTVANSAASILGLPIEEPEIATINKILVERNDPLLGWVPYNMVRRNIKNGDIVINENNNEVASITDSSTYISNGILGVSPVPADFSLLGPFRIVSNDYINYSEFSEDLAELDVEINFKAIDRAITPLMSLKRPSKSMVDSAWTTVNSELAKLLALSLRYSTYSVSEAPAVTSALNSLLENGYDRCRELLLQGEFFEYVSTTERNASYSKNLMDSISRISVSDANISRQSMEGASMERDRYVSGWVSDTDPSYEYEDEKDLMVSHMDTMLRS